MAKAREATNEEMPEEVIALAEETAIVIQETRTEVDAEARIYIGPSLKGLSTGTVFRNGRLVPVLDDAIAQTPVIGELVVPVSKLTEAMKQLQKEDSALSRFYKAAINYSKGE